MARNRLAALIALTLAAPLGWAQTATTYEPVKTEPQLQTPGSTTGPSGQTSTGTTGQTSTSTSGQTSTTTGTSTSTSTSGTAAPATGSSGTGAQASMQTQMPAPIVIETKVDLTTDNPGPQDPAAAREEAINALDYAKREGCRTEGSREAERECIRRAQDEYNRVMAELGRR